MRQCTKLLLVSFIILIVFYYLFSIISIRLSYKDSEELKDPDSKFIDVKDIKVHYKDQGKGACTFLLIHGFGAGTFSFEPVVKDLSKFGRVVALDLPGFGLSERPKDNINGINPYGRLGQVGILKAFIEKLDLKNIFLVGHSMGGGIAFIYASMYPERIKALVLEAPAISNEGAPSTLLQFLRTKFGKFVFPMFVKPLTSAIETVIYKAYYDKSKITDEMRNNYKKALKVRDWDKGLYYLSTSPNNVDIEPLTKDFNIPTLVIFGSNVEIVSKYSVVNFSSKLKNVKIVEISECGHIPHEEKGNDFINSLIALRSLNLFFYAL